MNVLLESLLANPIIASIKNLDNLGIALESPCENIFLMTGNIFNLKEISQSIKSNNKGIYISVDDIDGFSKDTWGLEYIIKNILPNGIITRKPNLVKLSKDMGVFTIQQLFIHDSMELEMGLSSIKRLRPHVVCVSPGIIPKIITKIGSETQIPIIANGLIENFQDINRALGSGAIGISSSRADIWNIDY